MYATATLDPRERQNHHDMLTLVRDNWLRGYLDSPLAGVAFPTLSLQEQPFAASASPPLLHDWANLARQADGISTPAPATDISLVQIFDRHRELLILGEPGSGKTTLLLELTRTLLDRAQRDEAQPIPVVFPLAPWANKQRPLADWLVDELRGSAYQLSEPIARRWVADDWILPVLDGLDEVAPESRAACVAAINTFRDTRAHRFPGLVVTSRVAEYQALPQPLEVRDAVLIQPLRREQVEAYLVSAGDKLAGVRAALLADPELWQLAESPLMLTLMSLAYQDAQAQALPAPGTLEQRRHQLLDRYVDAAFARRAPSGARARYTRERTMHWLGWLADALTQQSEAVFYLDRLQPEWLPTPTARDWYALVDRLGSFVIVTFAVLLVEAVAWAFAIGPTNLLRQDSSNYPDYVLLALIAGVTAGLLGGGPAPPRLVQSTKFFVNSRRILIGSVGGILAGAVAGAIEGPLRTNSLQPTPLEFGVVLGVIVFWLCIRFSSDAPRGGNPMARRTLLRGLIGAALGAAVGLLLAWCFFVERFTYTQGQTFLDVAWASIANAPQWVPSEPWPNVFTDECMTGLLYGLAIGVLSGLLVRPSDKSEGPPGDWMFNRGAVGGALAIGAVPVIGQLVVSLTASTGGEASALPSQELFMLVLQSAVLGGLVGGVAGAPGTGNRHISVAEPARWSFPAATLSGLRGLLFGLWAGVIVGGLAGGLMSWRGVSAGDPLWADGSVESRVGGAYNAISGLTSSVTTDGVQVAVVFALVCAITFGLGVAKVEPALTPNEGIWRSARRARAMGLASGALIGVGLLVLNWMIGSPGSQTSTTVTMADGSLLPVGMASYIAVDAAIVGVLFGVGAALAHGGYACLSHVALRLVLWRSDSLPLEAVRFLDYATERTLLRRVGGGYQFHHGLVQDYVASAPNTVGSAPNVVMLTPARRRAWFARPAVILVSAAALATAIVMVRLLVGKFSTASLSANDYELRANTEWLQGNNAVAELDATRAITLDPSAWNNYNRRALIRVSTNELRDALADANKSVGLCQQSEACIENELSHLLDTRGYVYLKLARYESAIQDYQQALDSGNQYPTVRLGRGLAYAALSQNAQALDDITTLEQPSQVPFQADQEIQDLVLQARQARDRLRNSN
jgi:hypothetical protein